MTEKEKRATRLCFGIDGEAVVAFVFPEDGKTVSKFDINNIRAAVTAEHRRRKREGKRID